MTKQFNLQDTFLNSARKSKTPVTIHVTNGFQIKNAVITGYDSFVVTVEAEGQQMMIYKSAISTVTPRNRLNIHQTNEEQENGNEHN